MGMIYKVRQEHHPKCQKQDFFLIKLDESKNKPNKHRKPPEQQHIHCFCGASLFIYNWHSISFVKIKKRGLRLFFCFLSLNYGEGAGVAVPALAWRQACGRNLLATVPLSQLQLAPPSVVLKMTVPVARELLRIVAVNEPTG